MIQLFYMDTDCFQNRDLFAETYEKMSRYRRNKIDFYRFPKDRYLSMGAGYLLAHGLEQYGMTEQTAEVSLGENGKPYLKNSPVFFNLSHSGTVAACAFSEQEIGMDVETVQSPDRALRERVCRPTELAYLEKLDGQAMDAAFTRLWTVKESYMKYLGTGLTLDPLELEIDFMDPCTIRHKDVPVRVFFKTYRLAGYCLSICSTAEDFPSALCEIYPEKIRF